MVHRVTGSPRLWVLIGALLTMSMPVGGQQPGNAPEGQRPVEIAADAGPASLFADFLHYARLGRFTEADAYARALLAHPDLDPVTIMEAAKKDKKSVDTLMIIIKNSTIGDAASRVMELIHQGENLQRQDPEQIRGNIERLGGNPQQEFFAIRYLAESGEHAVPWLVKTLLDPAQQPLWPRVAIALTRLGKDAVGPLVMALSMENNDVRLHVIRALGEIGYPQAVPYLSRLLDDGQAPAETRQAAAAAIERIHTISGRDFSGTTVERFHALGEAYYYEVDAVRADPRLDLANVWYWDTATQELKAMAVPEPIFGPVMAMRCCEEALRLQNDTAEAIALWLAANIRREARLGFDVESGDPEGAGAADPTRPAVFPRALYFTQAAGPRYAHRVLARAVQDQDTAVALGAIEALRITAGESSLIGTEDAQQALVLAMRFPDLLVRLRAALALGQSLPKSSFADAQFVVPLLATAVNLTGGENVVVVDADGQNLNRVMSALRAEGRTVIGETGFYRAMERARAEFPAVSAFFVSTDVAEPELPNVMAQLRGEFIYAKTPVILLTRATHALLAEETTSRDRYCARVSADAEEDALVAALERLRSATGQAPLNEDLAGAIALESVETLRSIAVDGRTVYDFASAESALIAALSATSETLRSVAASVLALSKSGTAQQAVARLALDDGQSEALRVSAFASLAESAKNHGNLLASDQVSELVKTAQSEENLTLRTSASRALGALNLADNRASEIIRGYYGG